MKEWILSMFISTISPHPSGELMQMQCQYTLPKTYTTEEACVKNGKALVFPMLMSLGPDRDEVEKLFYQCKRKPLPF